MSTPSDKPGLVHVLTSSLGVVFLRGQLENARKAGYEVTVISSPGNELSSAARTEDVRAIAVAMSREISPARDLLSLLRLWRIFLRLRPMITNVGTPKAGLLGGLAAFLARVPCRIYTLHGLRLETTAGMRRRLLWFSERLACLCAHRVICVSESLRRKAVTLGLVPAEKTIVLGAGSVNGVDASRYSPLEATSARVADLRAKLGIPASAPVLGFVGRFTRDKGIDQLLQAFTLLQARFPQLRLLLVGDFEAGDPPSAEAIERIQTDPQIISTRFVDDAAPYYQLMDVLALPTYREGFPNAVLEAQAAGKPAVVTNATGAVDSVLDGVGGLVVPVRDTSALAQAIATLLADPSRMAAMGLRGRERVLSDFQPAQIRAELMCLYESLLAAKGLPIPSPSVQDDAGVPAPETRLVSSCANSQNG